MVTMNKKLIPIILIIAQAQLTHQLTFMRTC